MDSTNLSPANWLPKLQTAFEKLDVHLSAESFLSASSPSNLMALSNTNTKRKAVPALPTTFHYFTDLPAELRLKIWKYTQPEQRYFTTSFEFDSDEPPPTNYTTGRYWDISCSQPSPALLFVCRESRDETLMDYLPIRFRPPPSSRRETKTKTLYINPKTDVVYLSDMDRAFKAVSLFAKQGVSIRKLGFWCSEGGAWNLWYFMRQSADYETPLFSALKTSTELEELQIEVGDETRCDGARRCNGAMSFQAYAKGEIEGWGAPGHFLRSLLDMKVLVNATFLKVSMENQNWKRPEVRYGRFEYAV